MNFFAILAAAQEHRYKGLVQSHASEDKPKTRPWRVDEAVMVAALDVVVAGVSYLL